MNKKLLHKQRVMTYFIDATYKIIEEEGIENVTIRKAADLAGYNSATLYNYFENLDHLILFSSMKYLRDYTDLLPNYIAKSNDKLDQYFAIWECFCTCAFSRPQIYNLIFFSDFSDKLNNLIEEYYEIFPDEVLSNSSSDVKNMLLEKSIHKRNLLLLLDCVNSRLLPKENIETINSVTVLTFQSMLNNLIKKTYIVEDISDYVENAMSYIKFITLKTKL